MKKILTPLLTLVCLLCLAVCFVGCDASALKYGEKYYFNDELDRNADDADKKYFIFNKNGTGIYHYYYKYESTYGNSYTEDYTITFSYTFMDKDHEGVVCTFESVEYAERNTKEGVKNSWDRVLSVSENILMSTGGGLFYSESYLKAHPEFCKP